MKRGSARKRHFPLKHYTTKQSESQIPRQNHLEETTQERNRPTDSEANRTLQNSFQTTKANWVEAATEPTERRGSLSPDFSDRSRMGRQTEKELHKNLQRTKGKSSACSTVTLGKIVRERGKPSSGKRRLRGREFSLEKGCEEFF